MTYPDVATADTAPEKGKDAKKPDARLAKYWREISAYNSTASDWKEQSEKIVKLYLDQIKTAGSPRRFALLWSNTETLKPAIYGKTPTVLCSRRYKDPDPVGRIAAELLERATNTTFDLYNVDEVFRMVRDDRLLTARGQAWVRYEASFESVNTPADEPETDDAATENEPDDAPDEADTYDRVSGEKVCVDYVSWPDFGHNVTGTWKDVWLVWRKVYKTKEEVEERFDKGEDKVSDKLTYQAQTNDDGKGESAEKQACIYELWDSKAKQTIFISRDYNKIIEEGDPPLKFRDFFPCPEPCYGSKTGKSLIPTPDYRYYQDQANEIDDLTDKIANLTEYLIVRAFVPAGPSADGSDAVRIMIETLQGAITTNKSVFVPVESWAGFTDKGGAGKLIDWLPLDMVMIALKGAVETRNQLIQDVYQITGIADILRGETDPNETLGAQELKAQTGTRRIKNAKDDLARFCCDIAQLVAEVIADQFQPQTIAEMTGFKYQPPMLPPQMVGQAMPPAQMLPGSPQMPWQGPGQAPQMPPQTQPGAPLAAQDPSVGGQGQSPSGQTFDDAVMKLLRNDKMRGFLIDIETDSTIQPDEDAEKQRRTEFLTAVGGFIQQAAEPLQLMPALTPMISEMLLFMVRGFRAGRNLEEVIEKSLQQLGQQLTQAQQNPKPDPKMQIEQVKAQAIQAKTQAAMQVNQQKVQGQMALNQQDIQIKQQELVMKQQELAMEQRKLQMEEAFSQREHALKERELAMGIQASSQEHAMSMAETERQHELSAETMQAKHDTGLEMMAAKAKQAKQQPRFGAR